jgi:hypothetical protein
MNMSLTTDCSSGNIVIYKENTNVNPILVAGFWQVSRLGKVNSRLLLNQVIYSTMVTMTSVLQTRQVSKIMPSVDHAILCIEINPTPKDVILTSGNIHRNADTYNQSFRGMTRSFTTKYPWILVTNV